jgi:hypothetical protein
MRASGLHEEGKPLGVEELARAAGELARGPIVF